MISQLFMFLSAAVVSLFITFPLVWALKLFHASQSIREEGPPAHRIKAGTPTMGGIGIILTIILFALIFIDFEFDLRYLALVFLVIGFAILGLVDDLLKIVRKHNLGLTFWQKIIIQTLLAALFSLFLLSQGHHQTISGILEWLGFSHLTAYYLLLTTFIIVGTANATNLTDGLNGLLAGTTGMAFLAFAVLSSKLGFGYASIFSLASAGAVLAFLYFNFPKARVFMGDVGSLALGAGLAGIAILIHKELRLAIIGGVFLVEALSVMLQVGYYKLYHKRIFKMTPLHHHFELSGWSEVKIAIAFWIASLLLGAIGIIF